MTTITAAGFLVMTLISVIVAFVGLCLDVHKPAPSVKGETKKLNTIKEPSDK